MDNEKDLKLYKFARGIAIIMFFLAMFNLFINFSIDHISKKYGIRIGIMAVILLGIVLMGLKCNNKHITILSIILILFLMPYGAIYSFMQIFIAKIAIIALINYIINIMLSVVLLIESLLIFNPKC